MKFSRKFLIVLLIGICIFMFGATIGSYRPNLVVYGAVAIASIVTIAIGAYFYSGHVEKDGDEN